MRAVVHENSSRRRGACIIAVLVGAGCVVPALAPAAISDEISGLLRDAEKALVAVQAAEREAAAHLPSGAEVLERFVEVTGGRAAYAAVHNRVMAGTLEFVGMGIQSKVEAWQVAPNQFYTLRNTEGLGPVEEGCDGSVVWSSSLTQGPELARGVMRAFKLRSFRFNAECHWRELYERAECVGVEEVDGTSCHKVMKYPAEGEPETAYYAVRSGLLVATHVIVPTPMGNIPTETIYSDYRKVGGLLVPHREVIRTMGREQRMDYDSIVFDGEIPEGRFDLPADIQLLVERYRAKAEAGAAEPAR